MGYMFLVSKAENPNVAPSPSFRRRRHHFLIILLLLLSGHLYLSFTGKSYEHATSISNDSLDWIKEHLPWPAPEAPVETPSKPTTVGLQDDEFSHPAHLPQVGLSNATFIMIIGDPNIKYVLETLVQLEDRFNHKYHYPYTFLSRKPFTEEFKKQTANVVSSKVSYGIIPPEQWDQPDHIDTEKLAASRREMMRTGVPRGGSLEFRNENRFNSGFFFRHELTLKYRYYWRIEPGVKFPSNVDEDPFMYLQEHNKVYGFISSMSQYSRTVANLWNTVNEFTQQNPQYVADDNAMRFISDDEGINYNLCNFWNSFEIADMDFWRSEAYTKYFEFLDANGGFYYDRWDNGPVQSIGVSLFARKDQLHFFKDIGYWKAPYELCHCSSGELNSKGKCWCNGDKRFKGWSSSSCNVRLERLTQ
ncbi:glycosyltransferase family 15 protein [Serendipita vermifera]|nr:glycosyltransferase family 15 protein [Serendipita vermifera]